MLALYHRLWMTASYGEFNFREHFASQCGIEAVIYDVVTVSFYPGVVGNPELDLGRATTVWMEEHAQQKSIETGKRSDEEKHLRIAKRVLNKNRMDMGTCARTLANAEIAIRLFAATKICHDADKASFTIDLYLQP